jgi:hypothetical protein
MKQEDKLGTLEEAIEFDKKRNYLYSDTIETIKNLRDLQGSNGNWNYDPYMHGMYNGMELILSVLEGRNPEFKDAPKEWVSNI